MKKCKYFFITFTLLLCGGICFSQDTAALEFKPVWNFSQISLTVSIFGYDYYFTHSPTKKDSKICRKYSGLITAEPTEKNHINYYKLACSLWEVGRLAEAEKMFLKIVESEESYYAQSNYHWSGTTYGYGSFTSNYQNYACRYLTKIYIEEKKFEQALKYIGLADKEHTVVQGCGTGHMWYRQEIDGLYALCYEGLGKYDSIVSIFMNQYADYSSRMLIRALKKMYSPSEINEYLKIAEQSIVCEVDTFLSSTFMTENYGEKNENTTEIKYTSGTGTAKLFGRLVTLPRPHLQEGEKVTREHFVREFKASRFYRELSEEEEE